MINSIKNKSIDKKLKETERKWDELISKLDNIILKMKELDDSKKDENVF